MAQYPTHTHPIYLETFKKQLIRHFHLNTLEAKDEDLAEFLKLMGYMNIEYEKSTAIENKKLEEDDEDELSLDSFLENEFDIEESLAKSVDYRDNQILFERYKDGKDPALRENLIKINQPLVKKIAAKYVGVAKGFTHDDLINEGNIGLIKAISKYKVSLGYEFSTYATYWIRQAITRAIADKANLVRIPVHAIENINKINRIENELELAKPKYTIEDVCEIANMDKEKYLKLKEVEYKFIHESSLNSFVKAEGSSEELIDFIPAIDSDYLVEENLIEEMVINRDIKEVIEEAIKKFTDRDKQILQYRYGLIDGETRTLEEVGKIFNVTRERIRQIEAKLLQRLRNNSSILALKD